MKRPLTDTHGMRKDVNRAEGAVLCNALQRHDVTPGAIRQSLAAMGSRDFADRLWLPDAGIDGLLMPDALL